MQWNWTNTLYPAEEIRRDRTMMSISTEELQTPEKEGGGDLLCEFALIRKIKTSGNTL
jgi:hypothetical protein